MANYLPANNLGIIVIPIIITNWSIVTIFICSINIARSFIPSYKLDFIWGWIFLAYWITNVNITTRENCEAQGKGRAKGGPRKVTQRSFMDGGWWMVDILSLMLYIKVGHHHHHHHHHPPEV